MQPLNPPVRIEYVQESREKNFLEVRNVAELALLIARDPKAEHREGFIIKSLSRRRQYNSFLTCQRAESSVMLTLTTPETRVVTTSLFSPEAEKTRAENLPLL